MECDLGSAVGDLVKPQAAFAFATIGGWGASRAQRRKISHKKQHCRGWQPLHHTAAGPMHRMCAWVRAAGLQDLFMSLLSLCMGHIKKMLRVQEKKGGRLLLHTSCVYVYSRVVTSVACEGWCEADLMIGWASWVSKANPPSTSPSFLPSSLRVCLLCWRPILPFPTDIANAWFWLTNSMQTTALHNWHLGKKDACATWTWTERRKSRLDGREEEAARWRYTRVTWLDSKLEYKPSTYWWAEQKGNVSWSTVD